MTLESDRFARVTALDRWASDAVLAAWAGLDLADLQSSFVDGVLPVALQAMVQAQREAADIGADYVDAVAVREGVDPGPRVNRAGFAGVASDGRSLVGLLTNPFRGFLAALALGVQPAPALVVARDSFDEIITTQVQDAAREAENTGMAANTDIAGYLRVVEPGACGRCVILAGRFYKWNDGFDRHPRCRCSHRPLTRASEPQSPRELFDKMSRAEQERAFTKTGAEAIRLGAEPNLVVNARRGMTTAANGQVAPDGNGGFMAANRQVRTNPDRLITTEGTSRRGLAYQRLNEGVPRSKRRTPVRLMPESLIRLSKDRDDAIRLLRLHGYIL